MERRPPAASRWLGSMSSLLLVVIAADCGGDTTGPDSRGARITTDTEAKAAFAVLRSAAEDVAGQVPENFSAPHSVSGAGGTASVTGEKTSSSTNELCCSSTTRGTDLNVSFTGYEPSGTGVTVSGQVRWFDFYDSRTHCSDFGGCASTTSHSEALEGSSIAITFEHDGKTYSDDIDVDANSPSYTSSWTVEVTNGSGESFRFTAY